MKQLFLGIVFAAASLAASPSSATAQEADTIVIDGESLDLETNPLSPLIRSEAVKIPSPDEQWSSNWRGYVAKWEVRDGRLFLREVNVLLLPAGADEDTDAVATNVIQDVFAGKSEVPADWFSGTLVLPRGKLVDYVHMGYGSTYERYTILQIKGGQLVAREDLTADQFKALRRQRFAEYQKTPEYAERFKEAREDLTAVEAEDFLFQYSVEEYMSVEP